jgi:hypothetical protein
MIFMVKHGHTGVGVKRVCKERETIVPGLSWGQSQKGPIVQG